MEPRRSPDLPAIFESLNDDTLTKTLEFVGNKSYKSFGGTNKRCREVYITSGMTKETFVYGYAPLSVIIDRYVDDTPEARGALSKGVVFYNRKDVLDWAIQQQKSNLLNRICHLAGEEGRIDILNEVWNDIMNDESDKRFIFRSVDIHAARGGKLNVLKWIETKEFDTWKGLCALQAAHHGHLHIIQWLREEQGLELDGGLYCGAIRGGQLHLMKWSREQKVPWSDYTFREAARKGNVDILQWLHDEGCPWYPWFSVSERSVRPEVIDWCRVNGYGDRITFED